MEKRKQSHAGAKVAAGMGLAALAAAAAGAIYLYGTDSGAKKRKQIRSWSLRMRADVIERMEKMKDWSERSYNELIDTVAQKYKNVKNIDRAELADIVRDLKKHWKSIKRQVETGSKPAKRRTAKPKTSDTAPTDSQS